MEKLNLDCGVRSFKLGAGVLRFNPTDPNVFMRFMEAAGEIEAMERELSSRQVASGQEAVEVLAQTDAKIKDALNRVFGGANDFHAILGGVNLLAVGENGKRVVENLFAALEPVLAAGAKTCADREAARLRAGR